MLPHSLPIPPHPLTHTGCPQMELTRQVKRHYLTVLRVALAQNPGTVLNHQLEFVILHRHIEPFSHYWTPHLQVLYKFALMKVQAGLE